MGVEGCRAAQVRKILKEIDLKRWDHIMKDNPIPGSKGKPQGLSERYKNVVQKTTLPAALKAFILPALNKEITVAHLAFLLATCPGVEVLRIPQAFGVCGKLVTEVIQYATDVRSENLQHRRRSSRLANPSWEAPLSSMTDVTLGYSAYEMRVEDALTLLALPKLRNLKLYGLNDTRGHAVPDLPRIDSA
jgi:hypothetical protein